MGVISLIKECFFSGEPTSNYDQENYSDKISTSDRVGESNSDFERQRFFSSSSARNTEDDASDSLVSKIPSSVIGGEAIAHDYQNEISKPHENKNTVHSDESFVVDKELNGSSSSLDNTIYLKIDEDGRVLDDAAENWSCIYDRQTKILWEGKSHRKSGFTAEAKYQWKENLTNIQDNAIIDRINKCPYFSNPSNSNLDGCTTDIYRLALNHISMCGVNNWVLPNVDEMKSIVKSGQFNPAVDLSYFPFTQSNYYWTDSSFAYSSDRAWAFNFAVGKKNDIDKNEYLHVMLVNRNVHFVRK